MEFKSIIAAAPEMYELLSDISCPRRGSEAETWVVPPRIVQLAARILADIDTEMPSELDRLRQQNAELRKALETALAHGIHTREGRDKVRGALEKYENSPVENSKL